MYLNCKIFEFRGRVPGHRREVEASCGEKNEDRAVSLVTGLLRRYEQIVLRANSRDT